MRVRVFHSVAVSLMAFIIFICGSTPVKPGLNRGAAKPDKVSLRPLRAESEGDLSPHGEPDEADQFYRLKRAPDGKSSIPAERYLRATEHIKRMPQHFAAMDETLPSDLQLDAGESMALGGWTQLGPGNIGGRTRALLINPSDPNIMYAAGVAGGVWKTTNAGASWSALDDLLPNLAVCSLAFDPTDRAVIYAGTGEGYFNGDGVRGAGIFKTVDAGASWNYLGTTSGPDFYYVNDIVVSPNDPRRVYAATRTGVWQSDDGGLSWRQSLRPLNSVGGVVQGGCLDLALRTDHSTDYIFASCGSFSSATVYRNTDAGGEGRWTGVLFDSNLGRTTLAIAPSNQNIIYALASSLEEGNYNLGLFAVFKSTSSGDAGTWNTTVRNTNSTRLNTVLLSNPLVALTSNCSGGGGDRFFNQGWYDNVIAVDPIDPNRVWAGGVDLFRSDDGGLNWGLASYWWTETTDPQYVHADQHVLVFHPQYNGADNRILFAGNDGGIFRTDDARAPTATGRSAPCEPSNSNVRWRSLSNNYGVTQFYFGLPYPGGATYIGGTQDNGTLRGTDEGGVNRWEEVFGGDGGYVAVDPTDPSTIYVETTRLSIRKSTDGGETYRGATAGITELSSRFLFIAPFHMDPAAPQRLWTGGSQVWRTTDGAASWSQASATVVDGSISALATSPANPENAIVGTSRGYIHRTANALTSNSGTVWPAVLPRVGFVSSVSFDPSDPAVAYATYSTFGDKHVWKSTDAGANWVAIDGAGDTAIPDVPVHSIIVDPNDSRRLFIGTDLGVFLSTDAGASWARENAGFANVVTESLSLGTSAGSLNLFAFTHGRGVWRIPIGAASPKIVAASVVGKKLLVFGQNFDIGSVILVNGASQKTSNDGRSATTNLTGKKAGKKVGSGQTVTLQVRRADGILTPEFRFTRQ